MVPAAAGAVKLGAALPGRRPVRRERPRQSRGMSAPLDDVGAASVLERYTRGTGVITRLPVLSTWLGHIDPKSTAGRMCWISGPSSVRVLRTDSMNAYGKAPSRQGRQPRTGGLAFVTN